MAKNWSPTVISRAARPAASAPPAGRADLARHAVLEADDRHLEARRLLAPASRGPQLRRSEGLAQPSRSATAVALRHVQDEDAHDAGVQQLAVVVGVQAQRSRRGARAKPLALVNSLMWIGPGLVQHRADVVERVPGRAPGGLGRVQLAPAPVERQAPWRRRARGRRRRRSGPTRGPSRWSTSGGSSPACPRPARRRSGRSRQFFTSSQYGVTGCLRRGVVGDLVLDVGACR